MNTDISVPLLRFPSFIGEWNEFRLGTVVEFSKGKGLPKADIDPNGETECIRYGELYTHYSELIENIKSSTSANEGGLLLSKYDDVIIPASGESAIDIATASCVRKKGVALGGDINIMRSKLNGLFLAYYLNNKKKFDIARYAQGISIIHLYASQLKLLNIFSPNDSKEADKISEFISSIDEKIDLLKQKHDLLQLYKKGVEQQLFSQTIRFKDKNGKDFPSWTIRRFGEFIKPRNEVPEDGNVFSLYSLTIENGIEPKSARYVREFLVNNTDEAYKVVKPNDFALNPMNLRFGAIAKHHGDISVLLSKYYDIFYCDESMNSDFFETYLQSYPIVHYYNRMATGTLEEKKRVHYSEFINFEKLLPCVDEQNKIANFLLALNKKINLATKQIELTQTFKKGLLQQMFV